MSNATNATVMERLEAAAEQPAYLISLGFMITAAVVLNLLASRRVLSKKLDELSLRVIPMNTEFLSMGDAARFPITGSCLLFGLYVLFKYVPKDILNAILTAYLVFISVGTLSAAVKPILGANVVVGLLCCAVGGAYYTTHNWVLNNVLAFGICITGIEAVPIKTFGAGALLLCGLFVYDVFWVFGTDVMVTVATSVQGPIKILFPRDVFGDHKAKSLLGLGDIIIPGFYLMMMLRYSLSVSKGKSSVYFNVCMVSYLLSLVNAMVVMVGFNAAQPVLLYIVPWLLATTLGLAAVRGELGALLKFDEEETDKALLERAKVDVPDRYAEAERKAENVKELGFLAGLLDVALSVFGMDRESQEEKKSQRQAKRK